jgi:spermidine synthase
LIRSRRILCALLFGILGACGPRASRVGSTAKAVQRIGAAAERVVHSEESPFGKVLVIEDGKFRYLRFDRVDGDDQSMISISDPRAVPMDYVRAAAIGLACAARLERVLMIGLGGGTFSTLLRQSLPDLAIDVVEVNPVVVRVAKRFFGVREDARLRIHLADGLAHLRASPQRYDLVFLDAYGPDDIPDHLGTPGFFELVRARLAPGGVAVMNLSTGSRTEPRLHRAFASIFPAVACVLSDERENRIVLGRANAGLPPAERLRAEARRIGAALALPFDLGKIADRVDLDCGGATGPK